MLCSVEEIGKVEIANVVANDDIRVHLFEEVSPGHEHLFFSVKLVYLGVDDQAASVEYEDIPNERLGLSVSRHHIGNLDDRILIRFWEDSLASGAFDIERQDSHRRHLSPLAFMAMRN
jgi:hypothetical protein